MRRFFLKIRRRRQLDRDLEQELAFHREMAAEKGNPIPFGNPVVIKEEALDLWRFTFLENLWRDLVYALRGLRRSPALVLSAVLSLALGIGVNTTIFSLAVGFLLSEPSVSDSGSVVSVRLAGNSHVKWQVVDFVRESGVFADVVGEHEEGFVNWNDGTQTRPIFGVVTTKNYFTALGVPMAYGRGLLPGDPNEVVVLNNQFWRKHFSADPSIVGRSINLDGKPYTVVGVLPSQHRTLIGFGFSPDVYLPYYLEDTILAMYARLKPGMSIDEARAGLTVVGRRLDTVLPERYLKYGNSCEVKPVSGFARIKKQGEALSLALFFLMLQVVLGLVLLIACANVASLLLARAAARRQEIAVRLALGASRPRLLQQLLVESMLLSIAGAGCGLALAHVVASLLARIRLPLPFPFRLQIDLDWRVATYAAILAIVATLACGLLPAWQSVRESIASQSKREPKLRLRRALVIAQVATSVIILVTGSLFLRNLFEASAISPGFDVRHTLRAEAHLPPAKYEDQQSKDRYVDQVLRELKALPGMEAVAAARIIPFTDQTTMGTDLKFQDTGQDFHARFNWNAVTPEYFRAMSIPVHQGRAFLISDNGDNNVAIVNQEFVKRYLGNQLAVGRVFLWGPDAKTPCQIVGVVGDTKNITIGEDPKPQLYEPLAQINNDRTRIQFVMKTTLPPATQLEPVRGVLRGVEPAAGTEVATLFSSIGLAFLPSQVGAALLGSTGVLGLLLATVGLYGVMVYSVESRTREIGLRVAVGAGRGAILRMVLFDSLKLTAIGSALGLCIALLVTRPLALFLVPGLKPADPLTFGIVALILGLTGLIASWGPVRRALAIDPMSALRYE